MQKDFYSDITYNRQKRRSSVILSSLLTLIALGTASIFVINKDWVYMGVFIAMSLLPIALLPISFKTYPVHGKPIVTVSDNGGGVETQELSKIFNRFHRTKKAKPQSAGIGLAITKAIVEKHHGTISAENTEKGLNIIMCFPHLDGYITY